MLPAQDIYSTGNNAAGTQNLNSVTVCVGGKRVGIVTKRTPDYAVGSAGHDGEYYGLQGPSGTVLTSISGKYSYRFDDGEYYTTKSYIYDIFDRATSTNVGSPSGLDQNGLPTKITTAWVEGTTPSPGNAWRVSSNRLECTGASLNANDRVHSIYVPVSLRNYRVESIDVHTNLINTQFTNGIMMGLDSDNYFYYVQYVKASNALLVFYVSGSGPPGGMGNVPVTVGPNETFRTQIEVRKNKMEIIVNNLSLGISNTGIFNITTGTLEGYCGVSSRAGGTVNTGTITEKFWVGPISSPFPNMTP